MISQNRSKYYSYSIRSMSQRTNGTIPTEKASKIVGIQFSILSPDEIRKGSVAEITSRDTYVNNKPVVGGLFDPRMGTLEPGIICPTDGLDYMQSPGYFGRIELARPLFYLQYLTTVTKILRCVCFKCSKLLISKERYKQALNMKAEDRWNFVFSLANKIDRCGEDTHDGCGCKQPKKIKKEGFCTLIAEWNNIKGLDSEDKEEMTLTLTPEICLKILRRMSDEDVTFMGYSPTWSRPDWMICQVLAVPPPAVRPSVKHDAQQRSDDDLTHIIVNIIKTNKTLQEKIQANAAGNVIQDWSVLLQYYVATLVDNKIPGVAAFAQRSGRPLKSIKERLNGKHGRVRGNLMGKRVDYSARSVITPDPNLSIRELGVPMKIAMNLTSPIRVNSRNVSFLTTLVQNGPGVYPGAKILVRKGGENIYLENVDRESIKLEEGDYVHRHMMDGDPVLFNRQPTLHRMSMMCHVAKIMPRGDTFRMNVGDTKPYNADFDGDEMNMHMPQDIESCSELLNLAAVPWQIISPANNKSIVGIFQDSLLGSYRFTREDINFSPRDAMNLLMAYKKINPDLIPDKDRVSNFDIISQILPPLSLKYKTKQYGDDKLDRHGKTYDKSNDVLEIENGQYIRGQMDKGVLGDGSRGLIHRICNDFGNMQSADFIDDLQDIITEYMKSSAYSVGISDLIAGQETNDKIAEVITNKKREVQSLIDQTHLGIFENKSGRNNEQEFETQVNDVLGQALNQAGRIGLQSLDEDNRFVIMVKAGSKGSEINISQMISCLGQQQVDGKRVPYGFEDRTLPHFNKYDDSPAARGFVEHSFIGGLTPQELFFHAMGGRVGLIDTAVKTSQTGYIQRRLVKGLEDIKIEYDMTVRNNKQKVIQFSYGDDGFDTVKVENQKLPIVTMSLEELYAHFQIPGSEKDPIMAAAYTQTTLKRMQAQKKEYAVKNQALLDMIVDARKSVMLNVFKSRDNDSVNLPVGFHYITKNVQGQQMINANSMSDITPLEASVIIDETFARLKTITYVQPTELFKLAFYYHLSTRELLTVKRFNRKALIILMDKIVLSYKQAIVAPGEMVGIIAAQSIGEPTTQMTLNTFHFAGVASKSNVTRGVPRIEEILSLSENPKNPSCTIHLFSQEELEQENAQRIMHRIEHTKLREVVNSISICFDPDDSQTLIETDAELLEQYAEFENVLTGCLSEEDTINEKDKSRWIIRMELNAEEMLDRNLTVDDINFAIKNAYRDEVNCVFSDYNNDNLVFRLRLANSLNKKASKKKDSLDQQDEIYMLKNFQDQLLDNLVLRGIKGIGKLVPRKITDSLVLEDGSYSRKETWVLDTIGTNLIDLLGLDYIDSKRTYTNDIQEIYRTLGIEAARQSIFNEISEVIEFDNTYINYHHLSILCDRMTCSDKMISIFRHGINNDDIGPIAKASFEETPEMFLKAARHGELDPMRGISANVMTGQQGFYGTNAFSCVLDIDAMSEIKAEVQNLVDEQQEIADAFKGLSVSNDPCSINNLAIATNVQHIQAADLGKLSDDYDAGF
uniref:DNA-directed RNA polymerase n=1 Tax=viral metagenome TaxID=1070528 RepID=A0A6C0LGE1_9ZZZZ